MKRRVRLFKQLGTFGEKRLAKIVFIDDNEKLREMIKCLLEGEGYEVFTTGDGNLGVQIVKEQKPELLITDILMPDKEGLEIINELRQADSNLKILAVSGGGMITADQYLTLANALGADKVLSKPFLNEELLATISELIT